MLTLCGFSASNYHNKVKLALLEKGLPFEEQLVWVGGTHRAASPLGKVPYLLTPQGPLSESAAILEYLEAAHPEVPLLPSEPFAQAKVRELCIYLDLHLELCVRNLYPEAFFGGKVSDSAKEKVGEQLKKHIAGFAQLAAFEPFIAGSQFTLADCSALVHLPLVSAATKAIYGQDFLADLPVRDYLKRLGSRPSVLKVNEDRKANTALMLERMRG